MKNKIALSVALALAMVSENKAMEPVNQPLVQQGDQVQNQLAFIQNGALHFRGQQYPVHLNTLDFSQNDVNLIMTDVEVIELFPLFAQFPNLNTLNLTCCGLTANSIEILANHLPQDLTHLDLSYNRMGNAGAIALANHFPAALTHLILGNQEQEGDHQIGFQGLIALINHLPAQLIEFYFVSDDQMEAEGIAALANLPQGLTTLAFCSPQIGVEDITQLASHLPHGLTTLRLSENGLGNEEIIAFFNNLPENNLLTHLDLRSNEIGAEGVPALVNHFPQGLTHLNLGDSEIGNAEAILISGHLPHGLTDFDLSYNQIGDEGALALANHLPQGITNFNLSHNDLTPDGIVALTDILNAIPNLIFNLNVFNPEAQQQNLFPVAQDLAQNLVNQMQANYAHIQAPIDLSYQTFCEVLFGNFMLGDDVVPYNEFKIIASQATNMYTIGNHTQGQLAFLNQMKQLDQNVVFTSDFQDAFGIVNFPLQHLNHGSQAASFVFPAPARGHYPQTNYEFFVVQDAVHQQLQEPVNQQAAQQQSYMKSALQFFVSSAYKVANVLYTPVRYVKSFF
jgi:hypothetical protein